MSLAAIARRAWGSTLLSLRIFSRINGEQRAAAFAYYALFSMVPLVALLFSIGSLFFDPDDVRRAITEYVPIGPQEQQVIFQLASDLEKKRGGVSIVSVLILGWTSLRFFQALVTAVNRAWHTIPLPWWQMRIKNLAMIAVVASGLGFGILVPAVAQGVAKTLSGFSDFLTKHFPDLHLAPTIQLIEWSRLVIGTLVLFYTFSMLYMLAPRRRVMFRQVWLPAFLVTITVQVCQVAFVIYLPRIVDYGIYGTIGGLMLLLLWVYVSGMMIILGGCLCVARARLEAIPSTLEN